MRVLNPGKSSLHLLIDPEPMDALEVRRLRVKYAAAARERPNWITSRISVETSPDSSSSELASSEAIPPEDKDETLEVDDHLRTDEMSILRRLCATPPLSDAEIAENCFWIESGVLAEERLLDSEAVSEDFQLMLSAIVYRGFQSYNLVFESNLRLVLDLAKRMSRRIPLSDRFQAGCMGLMRAIEGFDYARGFKFSTYASSWIRQSISREIANAATVVRTPVHIEEKLVWDRENERMRFKASVNLSLIDRIWILSLYEPLELVDDNAEGPYRWCSIQSHAPDPASFLRPSSGELLDTVAKVLMFAGLEERHLEILRRRFGFLGEPQTLDEIGKGFGVTRERIRQLEKQAMEALWENSSVLENFRAILMD